MDVEDGAEEADVAEKYGRAEGGVGDFAERGGLEEGPLLFRRLAGAHYRAGEETSGEGDEAEDACGPAEADLWLELAKDDRVEDAAEITARRGDSGGKGPFRGEILRHYRNRREVETACSETEADGLSEHHLPILQAETRHHEAQSDEKGACGDEGPEVASVVQRADEDADKQEQKGLDRADPGDVGG